MTPTLQVVDLFCGAGGTSTGILNAVQKRLHRRVNLIAVNHWKTAINTHSINLSQPCVSHLCEKVENLHPLDLIKSRRLHLLAASCECRFHSNARGGGPCNEQSRSQAWQLIRWATDIQVDNIMMENVREFMNWGPIHRVTHRPIKSRQGEFFRSFVATLRGLGYTVEWKVQVAADYGDPTSRQRFILMARKGKPITWPEPTHGPGRAQPWRTARECIDWSIQGTDILDREANGRPPLCQNTMNRIVAGLRKFGGVNAEPFIVMLRGTSRDQVNGSAHSLDEPLPTITAGGGHAHLVEPFLMHVTHQESDASRCFPLTSPMPTLTSAGEVSLVEPFIMAYHNGDDSDQRTHSLHEPLPTQDTSNRYSLVQPIIVQTDQGGNGNDSRARTLDQPLPTVVTKQNLLLVEPMVMKYYGAGVCKSVADPLDTVTTKARFLLVQCTADGAKQEVRLSVRTRMLQPHELAAAHSFPPDYFFTGSKADQTKQIGNSVPVKLAEAHAAAILS